MRSNADGTLTYTFVESVKATYPFYAIRLLGGLLFLSGMLIMAYNVWKTVAGAKPVDAPVLARRATPEPETRRTTWPFRNPGTSSWRRT